MPFFFDHVSQLVLVGNQNGVRALTLTPASRSASIVMHYYGHNEPVNALHVHSHTVLSASTELFSHCLSTGRLRWRALGYCGRRIEKLAVLGDVLVCCLEDCSVAMVQANRGEAPSLHSAVSQSQVFAGCIPIGSSCHARNAILPVI
jgi:hypothetical protein